MSWRAFPVAVIDATKHRFRPIMLTAAAAILGMIPIMHDVFWGPMAYAIVGPMAYAIVGGLAIATVLTLVFLPALYVAVNGIREKAEPATEPDAAAEPNLAMAATGAAPTPLPPMRNRPDLGVEIELRPPSAGNLALAAAGVSKADGTREEGELEECHEGAFP